MLTFPDSESDDVLMGTEEMSSASELKFSGFLLSFALEGKKKPTRYKN